MDEPGTRSNGHLPDPEAEIAVAIDFDGVLFDQSAHIRERFHEIHGVDIGPVDEWPWNLSEHPPVKEAGLSSDDTWEVFHSVHNDLALHRTDPVDADCRRVLAGLLEAGHSVDIVTARSPESREQTEHFLQRNEIPHERLIMGDHRKTGWDVLLDDLPHHVERVADDGSLGLLMDQPYNRAYEAEANPYRVAGFAEVERMLSDGSGAEA